MGAQWLWALVAVTCALSVSVLCRGAEMMEPFPGWGRLIPSVGPCAQTLTNSGMSALRGMWELAVAQTK